ncbi:hypothetical protein DPMN_027440 [Dreissena polymorpha]|uniref:Uncharacterized protein n=1 Tax=Dreissena polymorpha TaxID=45954 RepID=A0A9D4RF85_DREPO|nr:hypothetical protein DPMN_027440 [Dreissena polymorpha]
MVADRLSRLGLTINRVKSKVFKKTASNDTSITNQGQKLEEMDKCTYFWTTMEIRMQTSKPASVKQEQPSSAIGITTKINLFHSIFKLVLLYGADTLSTNITTIKKSKSSSTSA